MKELMTSTPHVLLATSMAAALTVVFVATLKILLRSFHRATAVVLALGVTILAVVGTAQIIFAGSQASESLPAPLATGNALMLWPFLAWAIASLLAQLLATTGVTAPPGEPRRAGQGACDCAADTQPDAKHQENEVKHTKPRGRPRKASGPSSQKQPAEPKRTNPPKPSQVASPRPGAGTHKARAAVGPVGQT